MALERTQSTPRAPYQYRRKRRKPGIYLSPARMQEIADKLLRAGEEILDEKQDLTTTTKTVQPKEIPDL